MMLAPGEAELKVGDLVWVQIQDQLVFPAPVAIEKIDEINGVKWFIVEGGTSGLTADQLRLADDPDQVLPSRTEAVIFLSLLDPTAKKFTFQTFADGAAEDETLTRILHGSLDQLWPVLAKLNNRGAGIFVTINETNFKGRTKENIVRVRALFVDLDGAPLDPVTTCSTPPHIVVESSPGRWHCYWIVKNVPLDHFKLLQKALATRFGGDEGVCDLPRVLRLPGFVHRKHKPFLSILQDVDKARPPYTFEQMRAEFPPAPEPEHKPQPEPADRGTDRRRGEAWAQAALTASTAELAHAGEGSRHRTLLNKAHRMGTMIARGWIDTQEVRRALFAAAEANGQIKQYGVSHFNDTVKDGISHGILTPHPDMPDDTTPAGNSGAAREKFTPPAAVKPAAVEQWRWHFHGDPDVKEERTYLVHDLIPEVGAGLISGQWGTYKTFVALDLAASVMSGTTFIEFPVNRRGAVLFVACEGQAEIPVRLKAVVNAKCERALNAEGKAPFAWIETCPPLLEPNGTKIISAMIKEAADRMMRDFGLPVAMIIFDTARKAAAQTKAGDDNDTTLGQNILKALETIAREANAFVIGTDHFGKDVSTGTRGASSKEDDSDLVLATLGERTLAGSVTNPRLAIRKRRSGENGLEFPFRVEVVTTGKDDAGRPITTLTISWAAGAATTAKPKPDKWSKSLRLLRQVLVNTLLEHGKIVHPFEDDFAVRAGDLETVRSEFHRSSTADGDQATKQATRQKAFKRATDEAQTRGLIGVREIKDVTYVWLAEANETPAGPPENAYVITPDVDDFTHPPDTKRTRGPDTDKA